MPNNHKDSITANPKVFGSAPRGRFNVRQRQEDRFAEEKMKFDGFRRQLHRRIALRTMAGLVGAMAMTLHADAQIALSNQVIAGGGGHSLSAGGCLVVDGTLGETGAGHSQGSGFALDAGYWARLSVVDNDRIFNNGFEVCQ